MVQSDTAMYIFMKDNAIYINNCTNFVMIESWLLAYLSPKILTAVVGTFSIVSSSCLEQKYILIPSSHSAVLECAYEQAIPILPSCQLSESLIITNLTFATRTLFLLEFAHMGRTHIISPSMPSKHIFQMHSQIAEFHSYLLLNGISLQVCDVGIVYHNIFSIPHKLIDI